MRQHGVPNFPDPDPQTGAFQARGIDVNSAQFQAASKACKSGLKGNG